MTELLTAAQMKAIEQAAMDSGAVTGLELMERAGKGVVEAIFEEWPELQKAPHRAVVLCGPGNNGGDGFVVARLLKEWGWEVEVFLYGDPEKLPPDARVNFERWTELGEVQGLTGGNTRFDPLDVDLVVDAIFGTGLTRGIGFEMALGTYLPEWDLRSEPGRPRIVAIDVPSGLCADSGRTLQGDSLWADLTVTFQWAKQGLVLDTGPFEAGRIKNVDIGLVLQLDWALEAESLAREGTFVLYPPRQEENALRPVELLNSPPCFLEKRNDPFVRPTHKYTHGHALILSGPMGRSGAARLAARGALRVGAGLATIGAPGSALMECATQLTAVMLRRCEDATDLSALLEDARLNALCLGPGLGVGEGTRALVAAALAAKRATVLDADALTSFADNPQALFDALHSEVVLTPHGGEFARLFPDIAAELAAPAVKGPAYSKIDATRAAAARAGCIVLFKGPDTVIAASDGRCAVNAAVYERAAPWLATAGSGDVLAGIITGLLARGVGAQAAAESGAWLHVEAARAFGAGLIAEDLPEMLPKVFRDLGL